ncbi:MAG: hypothetical protein EBY26_07515, partial [Microbacteriaceae bacterium]|nr:hypothetical protein [Microbacteriaceae bacterium]
MTGRTVPCIFLPAQIRQAALELCRAGCVVVPLYEGEELRRVAMRAREMVFRECVELKPTNDFGAIRSNCKNGKMTGSVFHHCFTRQLREDAYTVTTQLLSEIVAMDRGHHQAGPHAESLPFRLHPQIRERPAVAACPDCILSRPRQVQLGNKNYHRDLVIDPTGESSHDLITGGWVNLNEQLDQAFLFVKGSHLDAEGNFVRPERSRDNESFCRLAGA